MEDDLLKQVQGGRKLSVVPETLRYKVMVHYYSSLACPHFGIHETVGRIQVNNFGGKI